MWQGSIMHMSESTLGSQKRVWNPLALELLIPWLWVTQLVLIGEPESPERAANAFNWWICNLFTIFSWSDIMMPRACVCEEFFVLPRPRIIEFLKNIFIFWEFHPCIQCVLTMANLQFFPPALPDTSTGHLLPPPQPLLFWTLPHLI